MCFDLYLSSILSNQRAHLIQELIIEKITLRHERLDLTLQAAFLVHGQFFGSGNDHGDIGSIRIAA